MKKLLSTTILLGIASLLLLTLNTACDSNSVDFPSINVEEDSEPIKGTTSYIQKLSNIKATEEFRSRSSVDEEEVSDVAIQSLVNISHDYLHANNIDMSDMFESDDPRIAIVAMAIADIDKTLDNSSVTRTSIGGCVLEGLGVRGLVNGLGKKAAAKAIGKLLLKRAIPYVGWGLFAYDFIDCMTE